MGSLIAPDKPEPHEELQADGVTVIVFRELHELRTRSGSVEFVFGLFGGCRRLLIAPWGRRLSREGCGQPAPGELPAWLARPE